MRLLIALCGWPVPAAASPWPRTCRCRARARRSVVPSRRVFRGGRRPRFRFRRRDRASATRLRPAARSRSPSFDADAAADRAGRLRRQRHGASSRRCCSPTRARIDIKPAPVLRCRMAESVAAWLRDEAAPRAAKLGSPLHAVETYDDFECRGRNRVRRRQDSASMARATPSMCVPCLRRRPTPGTDRRARRQAIARRPARQRVPSLHHRARARLRRLPRNAYPSRSRSSAATATACAIGTCANRRRRPKLPPGVSSADAAAGHTRRRRKP